MEPERIYGVAKGERLAFLNAPCIGSAALEQPRILTFHSPPVLLFCKGAAFLPQTASMEWLLSIYGGKLSQ